MVIVCSAIIHTDLMTTAISNQYRDASHGQRGLQTTCNAEMQNANLKDVSRVGKIIGNARFSEMVSI